MDDSQGRGPDCGHVPQRSGRRARGVVGRAERADSAVIGPAALQQRSERDDQPGAARHAVRRSRQRDRPPVRQDSAIRQNADQRGRRHLQPRQRGAGADLQPELRPERQLAGPDLGAAATLLQTRRDNRLLKLRIADCGLRIADCGFIERLAIDDCGFIVDSNARQQSSINNQQ